MIKSNRTKKNLLNYKKYCTVVDSDPTSTDYFRIQSIPPTLYVGKNLLKIFPNKNTLVPNSKIYIEILDSNGMPIYHEILKSTPSDNSKYIVIYVYPDTPIGDASIVIGGRARINVLTGQELFYSTSPTSDDYKDNMNLFWSGRFAVSSTSQNNSEIFYSKDPIIDFSEKKVPYYTISSLNSNQTNLYSDPSASVSIKSVMQPFQNSADTSKYSDVFYDASKKMSIDPILNSDGTGTTRELTDIPRYSDLSTIYAQNFPFTPEMEGGLIYVNQIDLSSKTPADAIDVSLFNTPINYSSSIVKVLNSTAIQVEKPFYHKIRYVTTSGEQKEIAFSSFLNQTNVTASYYSISNLSQTPATESFVSFEIRDAEPNVGTVDKLRIKYKPIGSFGEFIDVGEFQVAEQNLFGDDSIIIQSARNGLIEKPIGFTKNQTDVNTYWQTDTTYYPGPVSLTYNASRIIESMFIQHGGINSEDKYIIVKPTMEFTAKSETEYKIKFLSNTVADSSASFSPQIDIYISGSEIQTDNIKNDNNLLPIKRNSYGTYIGSVNKTTGRIHESEFFFKVIQKKAITPIFIVRSGFWNIGQIGIYPRKEIGFSPNHIKLNVPVSLFRRQVELLIHVDYLNEHGIKANTYSKIYGAYFDGSNVVVTGRDNQFTGSFSGSYGGDGRSLITSWSRIEGIPGGLISSSIDTSSFALRTEITGAFTSLSSSIATTYLPLSGGTITGDVFVTGVATVAVLKTLYTTSSIIYQSGSTKFGDSSDDTHQLTGSLRVNGLINPGTITYLGSGSAGTNNQCVIIGHNGTTGASSDGTASIKFQSQYGNYPFQMGAEGNGYNFIIRQTNGGQGTFKWDFGTISSTYYTRAFQYKTDHYEDIFVGKWLTGFSGLGSGNYFGFNNTITANSTTVLYDTFRIQKSVSNGYYITTNDPLISFFNGDSTTATGSVNRYVARINRMGYLGIGTDIYYESGSTGHEAAITVDQGSRIGYATANGTASLQVLTSTTSSATASFVGNVNGEIGYGIIVGSQITANGVTRTVTQLKNAQTVLLNSPVDWYNGGSGFNYTYINPYLSFSDGTNKYFSVGAYGRITSSGSVDITGSTTVNGTLYISGSTRLSGSLFISNPTYGGSFMSIVQNASNSFVHSVSGIGSYMIVGAGNTVDFSGQSVRSLARGFTAASTVGGYAMDASGSNRFIGFLNVTGSANISGSTTIIGSCSISNGGLAVNLLRIGSGGGSNPIISTTGGSVIRIKGNVGTILGADTQNYTYQSESVSIGNQDGRYDILGLYNSSNVRVGRILNTGEQQVSGSLLITGSLVTWNSNIVLTSNDTSSFALRTEITGAFNSISSSFVNDYLRNELTRSFVNNSSTSSFALRTEITGAFATTSSSLGSRVTTLENKVYVSASNDSHILISNNTTTGSYTTEGLSYFKETVAAPTQSAAPWGIFKVTGEQVQNGKNFGEIELAGAVAIKEDVSKIDYIYGIHVPRTSSVMYYLDFPIFKNNLTGSAYTDGRSRYGVMAVEVNVMVFASASSAQEKVFAQKWTSRFTSTALSFVQVNTATTSAYGADPGYDSYLSLATTMAAGVTVSASMLRIPCTFTAADGRFYSLKTAASCTVIKTEFL